MGSFMNRDFCFPEDKQKRREEIEKLMQEFKKPITKLDAPKLELHIVRGEKGEVLKNAEQRAKLGIEVKLKAPVRFQAAVEGSAKSKGSSVPCMKCKANCYHKSGMCESCRGYSK